MKRYCSACEAEFDTRARVDVCSDCAIGSDAWCHWFEANGFTGPLLIEEHMGRIRKDVWDAAHSIIATEFGGVINVENIDAAAKLHLQRQADLAHQKLVEQEAAIAAKLLDADHHLAARLQKQADAAVQKTITVRIKRLFTRFGQA